METHVHGLCTLQLDLVVYDPRCSAVVGLDGNLGLLVAHLYEELVHRYGFAGVDV